MSRFIEYLKTRLLVAADSQAERRAAPRYATILEDRVAVNISVLEIKQKSEKAGRSVTLRGYTSDVSESGMGIVVPEINIGGFNITRASRTLRVALNLRNNPIEVHAVAARYVQLEADAESARYLIGMKITKISERGRSIYLAFLGSLK